MSLLALPDELLLDIYRLVIDNRSYDKPVEVLHYRLTCRRLESITTAAMTSCIRRHSGYWTDLPFNSMTIGPCARDLQMSSAIAKHVHLRHIVNRIRVRLRPLDLVEVAEQEWIDVFSGTQISVLATFSLDRPLLRKTWVRWRKHPSRRRNESMKRSPQAWYKLYHSNFLAQKTLFEDTEAIQTLGWSLSPQGLSSLRNISLVEQKTACKTTCQYQDPRAQDEGLAYHHLEGVEKLFDAHYKLFKICMTSLGNRDGVVDFHIIDVNAKLFELPGFRPWSRYLPAFLRNVRSISIGIHEFEWQDLRSSVQNWRRLIQACGALENLSISHIPDCNDPGYGRVQFTDCLEGLHFHKLKSFHLSNFYVKCGILQKFLLNHRTTLREIDLNALAPFGEDSVNWKSMLKSLRKELDLKQAELHLLGAHLEQMIHDDEMREIVNMWAIVISGCTDDMEEGTRSVSTLETCYCHESENNWDAKLMGDFLIKTEDDDDYYDDADDYYDDDDE